MSTLTYGAQTWALRYLNDLETALSAFFKIIFPYMVRQEFNQKTFQFFVLKQVAKWLNHLHLQKVGTILKSYFNSSNQHLRFLQNSTVTNKTSCGRLERTRIPCLKAPFTETQ